MYIHNWDPITIIIMAIYGIIIVIYIYTWLTGFHNVMVMNIPLAISYSLYHYPIYIYINPYIYIYPYIYINPYIYIYINPYIYIYICIYIYIYILRYQEPGSP